MAQECDQAFTKYYPLSHLDLIKKKFAERFPTLDFNKLTYACPLVSFHSVGRTLFMYDGRKLILEHDESGLDDVPDYYKWCQID